MSSTASWNQSNFVVNYRNRASFTESIGDMLKRSYNYCCGTKLLTRYDYNKYDYYYHKNHRKGLQIAENTTLILIGTQL
uniref:Uncharacterized protein n=1 Tax=Romanomermis culicivorax TaxID=13658 RepID=A0A915HZQ4_ROMCU